MAEHRGDNRRARALIVTAVVTAVVTAAVVLVTATATAQRGAPDAPATVKEVMLTMTVPSSDVIFTAASEFPKDDQQWAVVRKSAVALAESGKLLMTGERARDNTTWMDMARGMVVQAEATLKAAEARNAEALSKASDDVYATCETCHERYMHP